MEEIWKNIIYRDIDYTGSYQISNLGRVKSLERVVTYPNGHVHTYPEKIMKQNLNKPYDGYQRYVVHLSKDGKKVVAKVHQLVAEAFLEDTDFNPDGTPIVGIKCINHKNQNSLQNDVENLEYCDIRYNNQYGDRVKRITESSIGNHKHKLTKERQLVLQEAIRADRNNNPEKYKEKNKKHSITLKQKYKDGVLKSNISREMIEKAILACSKRVKCIETGEIFESATTAAKHINLKCNSSLTRACRDGLTAGGYHWEYVED